LPDEFEIADNFSGMNATQTPETLSPGMLQLLVNGVIVGNRAGGGVTGGVIQTRPGKRAQLAAVLPGKIAYSQRYEDANGVQHVIWAVADVTSTTGYLYDWVKDATTATRLTALGVFNTYLVQSALIAKYAVFIGNIDGQMRRTDLISVFEIAASPNPPTTALTPNTQPWNTDGNNVPGAWAADVLTTSPDVVNGTFTGASTGGVCPGWTPTGTIDYTTFAPISGGPTYNFLRLDDAASFVDSTAYVPNAAKTNSNNTFGGENGTGTGSTRYANHFLFTGTYWTDSGGFNDSIYVKLYAYNASSVLQGTQTVVFTPNVVQSIISLGCMFSFDGLGELEITQYKVEFGNPGIAARPGPNGPFLTNVSVTPYLPPIALKADSATTVSINGLLSHNTSTTTALSALDKLAADQLVYFWGGTRLSHVFSAPIDFTQYTTISIPFAQAMTPITGGLRATLNFKADASHAGIQSNPLQVLQTSTGQLYLQTDVSALETTNGFGTNLDSIGVMELIFSADTNIVAGTTLVDKPLVLSPLTFAGNLSINLDYALRYTESTSMDPSVELESGGSPISAEFVPNGLMASFTVTLPAPVNSSTAFYNIYRQGGTFTDPYFREEATLPVAAGVTTIPNLTWNGGTGTYTGTSAITGIADFTWNPTTRVYSSNIPDSDLAATSIFLFDHDATPTGATAIAVYQNRLALAVGSQLYISALTQGVSAGLYFNLAPDPANPNYLIMGNVVQVGALEGTTLGQTIKRIVTYGSRANLFFETRTFVLSGLNNLDFDVYENKKMVNTGLLAPNACTIVANRLWFLASQGLYNYDDVQLDRDLSYPIAAPLNPGGMSFGSALNAAAYAQSSIITHANRLILSAPSGTSSTINVTYVCDLGGSGAWVQWNLGEVLCGETFSGSGDQDELVFGCGDGQIYAVGNGLWGDTSVSSGTPAAVTMSGTLRRVTDDQFALQALIESGTVIVQDSTVTFTLTVTGPNGITWSDSVTLPTGDEVLVPSHGNGTRVGGYVRGRYLAMGFLVSSVLPTTILRMALKWTRAYRN
jgi:hypothetical protein